MGGGGGQGTKESRVLMDQKKENGERWSEKGQKAENVEKMRAARENSKTGCEQPHKTGRRQSRRREGNRKHREVSGEGCEEGETEPGRRHQRTPELGEDTSYEQRGSGVPGLVLSP